MKRALVVSGGGCKGAFAVGAIQWLLELGLWWDTYIGTSTGALIVPLVAAGEFELAKLIYSNVRTSQLLRKYCCLTLPWRAALYSDKGLIRIIERNYSVELHRKLNSSRSEVLVCTVSLNSGDICYWSPKAMSREEFMRAMAASASEPGLMAPKQIKAGGEYHVDGGVREIAPIKEAMECGATSIEAIVLEPETHETVKEAFTRLVPILGRTLSLMILETRENDIAEAEEAQGLQMTLIRPQEPLAENSLEFKPEVMREMMKLGYERAKQLVPRNPE
jgi:NTE family protein